MAVLVVARMGMGRGRLGADHTGMEAGMGGSSVGGDQHRKGVGEDHMVLVGEANQREDMGLDGAGSNRIEP